MIAVALLASSLATAAPETPQEVTAELQRLRQSMRSLAQRNTWNGVDRKYEEMFSYGVPLTLDDHHAGAEAALNIGDVMARRDRLERAGQAGDEDAWPVIKQIDDGFGRLYLLGHDELTPATMPFEPEPRNAIVHAQDAVKDGAFWGMLPEGHYTFAGQGFDLASGVRPVLVTESGITRLSDAYALLQETPAGYRWNGVDLDWGQARAVLKTRASTRRILEGAEASFITGIGVGATGVGLLIVIPVLGVLVALASVPFFIRAATGRRRAVARWTEEWAASAE